MVSIRKAQRKVWRWHVYIARQPNVHSYSRGRFRALDALWTEQDRQRHATRLAALRYRGRHAERHHHPHGQH